MPFGRGHAKAEMGIAHDLTRRTRPETLGELNAARLRRYPHEPGSPFFDE